MHHAKPEVRLWPAYLIYGAGQFRSAWNFQMRRPA